MIPCGAWIQRQNKWQVIAALLNRLERVGQRQQYDWYSTILRVACRTSCNVVRTHTLPHQPGNLRSRPKLKSAFLFDGFLLLNPEEVKPTDLDGAICAPKGYHCMGS